MATVLELPLAVRRPITLAAYLALPEDETVERMLIDGELWEYPMPESNRHHALAVVRVGQKLCNWLDAQPPPRGAVLAGDAGVVLEQKLSFGVDVAYVSAEVMAGQDDLVSTRVVGVPELAVEVISPGEVVERHEAKLEAYLRAGVRLVWVLNPRRRTVTAFRPAADPVMFSGKQLVTAPDVLPGFSVPAADLFG